MANHNRSEREVESHVGFGLESKDKRRVQAQMVNFCTGGSAVPVHFVILLHCTRLELPTLGKSFSFAKGCFLCLESG